MNSFTIPRKPKFADKTAAEPSTTAGKEDYASNQPILPRKKSTKKRSAQLEVQAQHNEDVADGVVPSSNTVKRPRQSNATAASVYQKIKSGRTIGYPITVTQGGPNRSSQHDAILLNCNDDENPKEYLAKLAYSDRVKIRWLYAGWNDFVEVRSITLKEMDAAPPVREAAVNSGLLVQSSDGNGDNMMVTRDEDDMEEEEDDDDAPILKARLNQLLEKGDEGENEKDENYNDQEDCDEPLLCYTKASSGGYLGRKANGQSSAGLMSTGHLDDAANDSGEKAVVDKGADWGGDGSDLVFTEATPQLVTSNLAITTDDADRDDEATQQVKEGGMSNVAIKTDDVDTDDEASQQDKEGSMPQPVASNMVIKTDEIDTDTDEIQPLVVTSSVTTIKTCEEVNTNDEIDKAAPADNLIAVSASTSDKEDAVVLDFFQKFNSFIEEGEFWSLPPEIGEMIEANQYLVDAKCPQEMEYIEVGRTAMEALCCLPWQGVDTRHSLYELVCLGGKATDKCYELIMAYFGRCFTLDHIEVLLLSGHFPTEKSNFFLDALAEGDETEENIRYVERVILRILRKDISLGEDLGCGVVNSTIINNINWLPPLVVGETHSEGGPMERLLNRFPSSTRSSEPMPQVTSNVAIKTDDIDTDDEATQQDKDGPTPQSVESSMSIKTDDIDTDTEETNQEEVIPMLQTSKTKPDGIDAPKLGKAAAPADNLIAVSASTSDEEDAMVLKLFEKLNSCIEERALNDGYVEIGKMIAANNYLVNAKCPQKMENIEVGCTAMEALCSVDLGADTRDLLYNFVCLGGKGTDKCYERIMLEFDGVFYAFHFLEVLLLSGYWPTEKDDFLLDAIVEDLEEEEDVLRVLRIFYKDISLGEDGFSCGDANSTIINNINGLPSLVVGETHSEGGPMAKLMNRFPCKRVICSTCKASKLAWRFSEEHKSCYDCQRQVYLACFMCGESKRLDHFTAEQRKEEYLAHCIDCEVVLVCSTCKVSKSAGRFSESQKSRGEAACCKRCEVIRVCTRCKVSKSAGLFHSKSICKKCDLLKKRSSFLVCSTCKESKVVAHFTKGQKKLGVNARCRECVEKACKESVEASTSLVCSICNVLKKRSGFSKGEKKKGEAASCKECVEKANKSLVCSICKVWKMKSENFTKAQKKKGEDAVCRQCEGVQTQTLAHTHCTVSVNKVGTPATNVPEKKGSKLRLCCVCNISKSYTNFSKNQLGKGARARCKLCLSVIQNGLQHHITASVNNEEL